MAIGLLEIKKEATTEMQLFWTIPNFSSLVTHAYSCPDFKFLHFDWYLGLCPSNNDSNVEMYIVIMDYVGRKYSFMITFGIVKYNKSIAHVKSFQQNCYRRDNFYSASYNYISREFLLQRKDELMPLDTLIIMCNIKLMGDIGNLKELNTLSENFDCLFANKEFCDIILQVEKKEFKVHKAIIAARSPVFASMFKHQTPEEQAGVVVVPDCNPDSFEHFLKYLYCGKLENISFHNALPLFKIAQKYKVQELGVFCIDCISQKMNMDNFFDAVALYEKYSYPRLFKSVSDFFNRNHGEIFKTTEWRNLLTSNVQLANDLLIEMSSSVEFVS